MTMQVSSVYPVFPGRERHLLRAQLARIVQATALAPRVNLRNRGYAAAEQGFCLTACVYFFLS
jgi:hypothetical protein